MSVSGPLAIVHDQTTFPPFLAMPSVTPKHTKAQILEHVAVLEARVCQGPSWQQVGDKIAGTLRTASREALLLVKDCYNAGALARQAISAVVAELSRPVLRSRA